MEEPLSAFARGDPHMVTLDGYKYTFNGRGEYVLLETADNSFVLQGRMIQATGENVTSVPATVFSAIVAKENGSDIVQFEVNRNGTLLAIVSGELIEFDITEQEFVKVTIKDLGNNTLEALFDSGVYIQAKGDSGIISSLMITLPDKLYGKDMHGLLGSFNGNQSDDFFPRLGEIPLPLDSTTEDIHQRFGITCEYLHTAYSVYTYF